MKWQRKSEEPKSGSRVNRRIRDWDQARVKSNLAKISCQRRNSFKKLLKNSQSEREEKRIPRFQSTKCILWNPEWEDKDIFDVDRKNTKKKQFFVKFEGEYGLAN